MPLLYRTRSLLFTLGLSGFAVGQLLCPLLWALPVQAQSFWSQGWRALKQHRQLPKSPSMPQLKDVVEFGVTVQPDGKMGIAAEQGSVEVTANGQSITLNSQEQTLVIPGHSPRSASPLIDDPTLYIDSLRLNAGRLSLTGHTDPVNLLTIDNVTQSLGTSGELEWDVAFSRSISIHFLVTTPSGQQRRYAISPVLEQRPELLLLKNDR